MISAAQGDGVADLKLALAEAMPEGPWLYPEDEVSDATDRMIAAELTREQIVNQLHQELPYATAVETETWQDRPDGSTEIRQQILVERDSQKAIVIGKGGRRLKEIGAAARAEIAQHLGRPVHLFLHVKVNPALGRGPGTLPRDRAGVGGLEGQHSSTHCGTSSPAGPTGFRRTYSCRGSARGSSPASAHRSNARSGRSLRPDRQRPTCRSIRTGRSVRSASSIRSISYGISPNQTMSGRTPPWSPQAGHEAPSPIGPSHANRWPQPCTSPSSAHRACGSTASTRRARADRRHSG